ncbi:hypothetical protein B0H17DRAFT_1150860 [Mycena rosella]|uniref:Uncharacterized protein n=1 Tax=Mycena rosella TaxID=1033263 RepID=A0AAD7BQL1_MYCRO|nr:hypothetical protein B0H17DRAFT_1150860 [Mycena rosella]
MAWLVVKYAPFFWLCHSWLPNPGFKSPRSSCPQLSAPVPPRMRVPKACYRLVKKCGIPFHFGRRRDIRVSVQFLAMLTGLQRFSIQGAVRAGLAQRKAWTGPRFAEAGRDPMKVRIGQFSGSSHGSNNPQISLETNRPLIIYYVRNPHSDIQLTRIHHPIRVRADLQPSTEPITSRALRLHALALIRPGFPFPYMPAKGPIGPTAGNLPRRKRSSVTSLELPARAPVVPERGVDGIQGEEACRLRRLLTRGTPKDPRQRLKYSMVGDPARQAKMKKANCGIVGFVYHKLHVFKEKRKVAAYPIERTNPGASEYLYAGAWHWQLPRRIGSRGRTEVEWVTHAHYNAEKRVEGPLEEALNRYEWRAGVEWGNGAQVDRQRRTNDLAGLLVGMRINRAPGSAHPNRSEDREVGDFAQRSGTKAPRGCAIGIRTRMGASWENAHPTPSAGYPQSVWDSPIVALPKL